MPAHAIEQRRADQRRIGPLGRYPRQRDRAEAALGAGLGNRPSLGYPGDKYEMGLEAIERIEVICAELAAEVFAARHAEIRVGSGALANLYVFMATLKPGDVMIAPPPTVGGHVTHHPAGAAGLYGVEIHAAPIDADGYTVLMTATPFVVSPHVYSKLAYDPLKDFVPITEVATTPNVLVVNNALPVRNLRELVALARKRPNELTYGSNGSGANNHLAGELLQAGSGIRLQHVPYKGSAFATNDLLGGHISFMFDTLLTALPLVTILVLVWMHVEGSAPAKIADYARYTFWYVLATLPMFALLPTLLARFGFWGALAAGALVTIACVLLLAGLGRPFGLRLW
jgi:hypothetical protein